MERVYFRKEDVKSILDDVRKKVFPEVVDDVLRFKSSAKFYVSEDTGLVMGDGVAHFYLVGGEVVRVGWTFLHNGSIEVVKKTIFDPNATVPALK